MFVWKWVLIRSFMIRELYKLKYFHQDWVVQCSLDRICPVVFSFNTYRYAVFLDYVLLTDNVLLSVSTSPTFLFITGLMKRKILQMNIVITVFKQGHLSRGRLNDIFSPTSTITNKIIMAINHFLNLLPSNKHPLFRGRKLLTLDYFWSPPSPLNLHQQLIGDKLS